MVGIFVIFASVAGLTATLLLWLAGMGGLASVGIGYGAATLALAFLVLRAARQTADAQEFQGHTADTRMGDQILLQD